jgi:predicted nucleotidyltransferase
MLALENKYLAMVQKILANTIQDKKVWAYGSRVKGTSHEGSDLDLVVRDEISAETLHSLQNAFSESNLPILVSVLSWADLPETFKKEINKKHEVLYY